MSKITKKKKELKRAEHLKVMRELHGPDWGKVLCDSCQKMFEPEDVYYGPDPYAHELAGDNTPVNLCKSCHHESCMDI